ncbi:hypothetical protein BGX21_001496, partial [Mortierella sp. AD011]
MKTTLDLPLGVAPSQEAHIRRKVRTEILNCVHQPVIRFGSRTDPTYVRSADPAQPADPSQPAGPTRRIRVISIDPTEPSDRIQIKVKSCQIISIKVSSPFEIAKGYKIVCIIVF